MAHYPIKCIRCTHIATNDTVLFNVEDTIQDIRASLAQESGGLSVGRHVKKAETSNRTAVGGGWWDDDDAGEEKATGGSVKSWWDDDDDAAAAEASSAKGEERVAIERGQLMTMPDMIEYCRQEGLGDIIPEWQKVSVTPDFRGVDIDDPSDDLLVGFSFPTSDDGSRRRARRRYCPACHCELPSQSGAMPTYVVTVMGTSSSGKTVYLCALNWLLSHGNGRLPYGSSMSCVTANRSGNLISELSANLFENGTLPATTQILWTEPLVIQINYEIAGKRKKCLLTLSDMRGEDLTSKEGDRLLVKSEFFSRADGFMVLISPLNIPGIASYFRNLQMRQEGNNGQGQQNVGAENSTTVHSALMNNINDYLLPYFDNGRITSPSVVMLSKCDLLKNHARMLNIPMWNAVVAAEPPIKYTGTYFANQYKGARTIVSADNQLQLFLQSSFSDPYYTSFSSLGQNAVVSVDQVNNKTVTNPNYLNPLRVMDPVIYLLIRFGFLPEFNKMEAGIDSDAGNRKMLTEWMETHT